MPVAYAAMRRYRAKRCEEMSNMPCRAAPRCYAMIWRYAAVLCYATLLIIFSPLAEFSVIYCATLHYCHTIRTAALLPKSACRRHDADVAAMLFSPLRWAAGAAAKAHDTLIRHYVSACHA